MITFESGDWNDIKEGTGLQGYVRTTYDQLTKKFGKSLGAGDKTNAEWVIVMYDQDQDEYHTVSIYDWKMHCTPTWEFDWHIGAKDHAAIECFQKVYTEGVVRADWR